MTGRNSLHYCYDVLYQCWFASEEAKIYCNNFNSSNAVVCSHLILAYTVRVAKMNAVELERNGWFFLWSTVDFWNTGHAESKCFASQPTRQISSSDISLFVEWLSDWLRWFWNRRFLCRCRYPFWREIASLLPCLTNLLGSERSLHFSRVAFLGQSQCYLLDLALIKAETSQRVLLRHLSLRSCFDPCCLRNKESSRVARKRFRVALYWLKICNFG